MGKQPQAQNENFGEVSLKLMKECPLCGREYSETALKIIDESDETRLVHMTCSHCSHAMLAMVLTTRLGLSSIGILTDLTAADVGNFQKKFPLTEDDILNFHNYLENNHKIFSNLFV